MPLKGDERYYLAKATCPTALGLLQPGEVGHLSTTVALYCGNPRMAEGWMQISL